MILSHRTAVRIRVGMLQKPEVNRLGLLRKVGAAVRIRGLTGGGAGFIMLV